MGFIEQFLRKDPADVQEADVAAFIARKVEENLNLEYKDIRLHNNIDELSKKVSGFANSAGGLLFLGVSEEESTASGKRIRVFPSEITWGNSSLSRETLEDRLIARIQPRIDGLRIQPVRKEDSRVIFLIDVPRSENPPHMAFDNRYYKRLNFETVPMEHYEVSDFFGRRRKPVLSLNVEFMEYLPSPVIPRTFKLNLFARNSGKAVAKFAKFVIDFENLSVSNSTSSLQRLDNINNGKPTVMNDTYPGVLYPSPILIYALGSIEGRIVDETKPVIVTAQLLAEDADPLSRKGTFSLDDIHRARDKHGAKPFTLLTLG